MYILSKPKTKIKAGAKVEVRVQKMADIGVEILSLVDIFPIGLSL